MVAYLALMLSIFSSWLDGLLIMVKTELVVADVAIFSVLYCSNYHVSIKVGGIRIPLPMLRLAFCYTRSDRP